MMDNNGFNLVRIELYNWGNFQDWQHSWVASPKKEEDFSLSLQSANSLLLGLNGAGKSTVIDGLIVCLLPYEGSLKLGVTHDLERGSSGGRDVESYVLGKYGSTGGDSAFDPKNVYSREAGASSVLMVFQHRGDLRKVTIGRTWWYSNYKLKEDSASFLGYGDYSLGPNSWNGERLLDPEGRPYKSVRALRQDTQLRKLKLQVFDKSASYFAALSSEFGGVGKEDLKLLNRAFYMKSIEQIDTFIREHMLIESSNESMIALVDNVHQASEIRKNIERCQRQLDIANLIVMDLESRKTSQQELAEIEAKLRLLMALPSWLRIRELGEKISDSRLELDRTALTIPTEELSAQEAEGEYERLKDLLSRDDLTAMLRELVSRRGELERRIEVAKSNQDKVRSLCSQLDLDAPKNIRSLSVFTRAMTELSEQFEDDLKGIRQELVDVEVRLKEVDSGSEKVRAELQHLQTHSTRIESGLYRIKTLCVEELKLPAKTLMFVGELISVKSEAKIEFERAVEASLQPIASNLLCLPEYTEAVTRWVNVNGLSRNVTVRRVMSEELEAAHRDRFDEDTILDKVEVLEARKNPFFHYLWRWLIRDFHYRIVKVEGLKRTSGRAVTREGLTKPDERFVRKLRKDFSYQLGWNPEERIRELIADLHKLGDEQKLLRDRKIKLEERRSFVDDRAKNLAVLRQTEITYWELNSCEEELSRCAAQIEGIEKKKGEKFKKLEAECSIAKKRADEARRKVLESQNRLSRLKMDLPLFESDREKAVLSFDEVLNSAIPALGRSLGEIYTDLSAVENELSRIEAEISETSIHKRQGDLDRRRAEINSKLAQSRLAVHLKNYESEFNDPDHHYEVPTVLTLEAMLSEWKGVKRVIEETRLIEVQAKFNDFYNSVLLESVKSAINDVRKEQAQIERSIREINQVLIASDYERLPTERRYLQIAPEGSTHDWIRKFNADIRTVSEALRSEFRKNSDQHRSDLILGALQPLVDSLHGEKNQSYFEFVRDIRNHFRFSVGSYKRGEHGEADQKVESFSGSRKDAKSSAQTTQLAYVLLASALAYRFNFRDPLRGKNSLRLIVLDEFGGKFDNEKPKDIVQFLDDMGFQSVFVSPMSKADLLAPFCGHLILVHKASASESKLGSTEIRSGNLEDACQVLEAKMSGITADTMMTQ